MFTYKNLNNNVKKKHARVNAVIDTVAIQFDFILTLFLSFFVIFLTIYIFLASIGASYPYVEVDFFKKSFRVIG